MENIQQSHSLSSILTKDDFTVSLELCAGRSSKKSKSLDELYSFAEQVAKDRKISCVAIGQCDQISGYSQIEFGNYLLKLGMTPLLYLSLQGKSIEQFRQRIESLANNKLTNVVVLGGDYPIDYSTGHEPIFELDSVQALGLLNGFDDSLQNVNDSKFYSGCVTSPFKFNKYELIGQYRKLIHKLEFGASFVISQAGYSLSKYAELKAFFTKNQLQTPILANIFIPGPSLAKKIEQGNLPGVVFEPGVADVFTDVVANKGKINGKTIRYVAKRIAVLKGLGFNGVHLGGPNLDYYSIGSIMASVEEFTPNWQEIYEKESNQKRTFFHIPTDQLRFPERSEASTLRKIPHPLFAMSWLVDWAAFASNGPFKQILKAICLYAENKVWLSRFIYIFERFNKALLYNCKMCGDCSLYTSSFVCVQANCPKRLLNGPCGGSINGNCEIKPNTMKCCWVDVYKRCLKSDFISNNNIKVMIPKRKELKTVSSWMNYFAGRDHQQKGKKEENGMFHS